MANVPEGSKNSGDFSLFDFLDHATPKPKILVVDDDEALRQSAKVVLQKDYTIELAASAENALERLSVESFDLVLMDLAMPGMGGMAGLRRLRSAYPSLPIVMMTAYQTVQTAVEAMKVGAVDYLVKPFDVAQLREIIAKNLGSFHADKLQACGPLRAKAASMTQVFSLVRQVADKDVTVLITGESGTGKELVAQAVHQFSLRQNKPFVVVNCAAIPENLIESELFGHEKGAFTNADRRRLGQFEIAQGGTLFLDEIGEIPPALQVKLLRFLQNKTFNRVGGNDPLSVDVRIVAATNRQLEKEVANGNFREDLFYRLNVVQIKIPALRDRREDIIPLGEYFLSKHLRALGKPTKRFSAEVLEKLEGYAWPGNVRELENTMERLAVLSRQQEILLGDLNEPLRAAAAPMATKGPDYFSAEEPFFTAVRETEGKLIRTALEKTGGVQTAAADMLGITRRILKYKMDKLGIEGK